MTIFMSNTTLIRGMRPGLPRTVPVFISLMIGLAACSNANGANERGQIEPSGTPEPLSGVPAPNPASDAAPSQESGVLSMEALSEKFPDREGEQGCFISFAYRGYAPETLIWDGEPCDSLTTRFGDRAFLEAYDNWDRLDASQKEHVLQGPESRVLYVEGEFTASIYPIGINGLTYEIVVTD